MGKGKLLNRQEWLNANGFPRDPFLPGSFHAESDIHLDSSCYCDRKDIEYLVGNFSKPGYRLIFSKSGAGKSGIRKRIHWEYERIGRPRVLILDYVEHNDLPDVFTIHHHVNRVICLAEKTLGKEFTKEKSLVKQSPKLALRTLVNTCRNLGYAGIYLLIDEISTEALEKVAPLALLEMRGFIIKFFISENLLLVAQSISAFVGAPQYVIRWDDDELVGILNQRLAKCLDSQISSDTLASRISCLCESHISQVVQDCFIRIARFGGGPGLMWKFGNYLLDEHMQKGRIATDLINYDICAKAQLELFNSLLMANVSMGDNLEAKFEHKSRRTINSKPKATVFLHCVEDDREIVNQKLYQALLIENYYPWMETHDILPGQNRDIAIKNAIKNAHFFIPCFSVQSTTAESEFQVYLKQAMDRSKAMPDDREIFIIPFRLDDCSLPDSIKYLQHFDLFDEHYLEKLYHALKRGLKKVKR